MSWDKDRASTALKPSFSDDVEVPREEKSYMTCQMCKITKLYVLHYEGLIFVRKVIFVNLKEDVQLLDLINR